MANLGAVDEAIGCASVRETVASSLTATRVTAYQQLRQTLLYMQLLP